MIAFMRAKLLIIHEKLSEILLSIDLNRLHLNATFHTYVVNAKRRAKCFSNTKCFIDCSVI